MVLEFLRHNRGYKSLSDINAALDINLEQRSDALSSLKVNKNIAIGEDGRSMRYKAEFDQIGSINDLRNFVNSKEFLNGVAQKQLEDAYHGILNDLDVLEKEEKIIYRMDDRESKLTYVFPRDRSLEYEIDEDIKELWLKVEMPMDETKIEDALKRGGIMDDQQGTDIFGRKVKHVAGHKNAKSRKGAGQKRKYMVSNVHMASELAFLQQNGKINAPKK
jgi:hypothetical protein